MLALPLLLLPGAVFAADAQNTTTTVTSSTTTTTGVISVGIYYGRIYLMPTDQSCMVFQNLDSNRKRTFYLDHHTEYYVDNKRADWAGLYVGDKVAVRYFAEGRIAIADAVYKVSGEFNPADYEKKKPGKGKKKTKPKRGGH